MSSKNFKVGLILYIKDQIQRQLTIDLVASATDVIRRNTALVTTGGYSEYPTTTYDIVGESFGKPYLIRLYATIGDSILLDGPKIDSTTQPGLRAIYAYNIQLDPTFIYQYDTYDRFPIADGVVSMEEYCKVEEYRRRLYDVLGNYLCPEVGKMPIITLVGGDNVTLAQATNFIEPGYHAIDNEDGVLTTQVRVVGSINNMWIGQQKLIYTVTDSDGNKASKVRGILVTPVEQMPVIELTPLNGVVSPINITEHDEWTEPGYMAHDFEDGNITDAVTVTGTVDPDTIGTYTLLYEVTDSAGNTVTATRVVQVLANHVPQITLIPNDAGEISPIHLKYGEPWHEPGATATDFEQGDVTSRITLSGNAVDPLVPGTYTILYTVADANGGTTVVSRDVIVAANITPGLSLNSMPNGDIDPARVVQGTAWVDPGATAIDDEDGDITDHIVVSGVVDTSVPGPYNVTYTITDRFGATRVLTRTVNVLDATTPPVITLGTSANGETNPINIGFGETYVDPVNQAVDMMGENIVGGLSVAGMNFDNMVPGDHVLTYSVTDAYGNVGTIQRVVHVADNVAPTITLNGSTPFTLIEGETYVEQGATATDHEQGNITPNIVVGGDTVDVNTVGSYNVTYTVTDSGGLSATVGRTVVVVANTLPVVTLTGDNPLYVPVGGTFTDPGATASDAENGDITANIVVTEAIDETVAGSYDVVYSVTDANGGTTTATRQVIVRDLPVITLGVASPIGHEVNTPMSNPGATAVDADGVDITSSISSNFATTVDTTAVGTYNATYVVTDSHGISASAVLTVNVSNRPVLTLTGDNPLVIATGGVYTDPGATASDTEDGDISNDIIVSGDTVDTSTAGSYNIVYTVADSVGLTASINRTVIIDDVPVITINGDNPLAIAINGTYTDPGASASDTEDGDISANITVTGDTVDTSTVGSYNVTYNVTDSNGISTSAVRTVTVSTPPVITILGDNPLVVVTGSVYSDPGATATDAEDGNLTPTITGTVDTTTPGDYTITYTATDSTGLVTTATRTVTVSTAPVVNIVGDNPMVVPLNGTYTESGAISTDAEDGPLTTVLSGDTVDTSTAGTYNVNYSATDSDGLVTTATRQVIVSDVPVVTLTGDNPLVIPTGGVYTDPGATAVDSEDGNLTLSIVVSGDTVDTSTAGTYNVVYSATDSNGLTSSVTRTVIIDDVPVITLVGDNPLLIAINRPYTDPGATASDTEDGDLTSSIVVSGDTVDNTTSGTYNVVYTVTDSNGLSSSVTRTVTISTPPTITLLGDNPLVIPLDGSYTDPGATANDAENGDITNDIIVSGTVNTGVAGDYTITYNVTDSDGFAATEVTRTVTVSVVPTITLLGDNPLVIPFGSTYADPGATANDAEDGDISANIVVGGDTVNTSIAGNYNVTYNVTDSDGLSATEVTRTVTVNVNQAPTITLVGSNPLIVEVDTTYTDPGATATDVEDGDISANITVTGDTVDTSTVGSYNVTYNVTDSNGITTTETRVVKVIAKPVITLVGASPLSVPINGSYTDPGATAIDTIDGDISNDIIVSGDTVDTSTAGTYNVVYNVTDSNGISALPVTRTVIIDTVPVINLTGGTTIGHPLGDAWVDPGYTANDTEDGDITANVVVGGDTIDINTVGSYNVTYNVTDSAGNTATEVTRTVNVSTKPVITLLGNPSYTVERTGVFNAPGATANDAEDGDITANIVTVDPVDMNVSGTYIITYNVTDSAGVAADEVTRTIYVSDAPTITLLGDNPLTLNLNDTYTDPGATANDAEDGDVTPSIVVAGDTVDTSTAGTYTVTYTATDSVGLSSTPVPRTVIVVNNNAPTITLLGDNPLIIPVGGTYTDPGATANDVEDGDISANIIVGGDTVDVNTAGNYNVTYTVTDSGGVSTTETRVVKVNTLPTITLTGDSLVYHEHNTGAWVDPGYTANDAEDGDITANVVISGDTVDDTTNGSYTVTYTVTDSGGSSATIDRTVIVADPPTLTINPDAAGNTGDSWGDLETHPWVDPGYTATGYDGNPITPNVPNPADPNTIGTYQVWAHATDPITGFVTSKRRTVQIHQSIAPTLTMLGDNPVTLITNDAYTDAGATAVDITTMGDDTPNIVITNDLDTTVNGSYTYTYTFTGAYGDVLTETRHITVTSANQAPTITVTGDNPAYVGVGTTYTDAGATANDTEDGDISANVVVSGSVNTNVLGSYTLTYSVTDSYGVSTTATRDVNVVAAPYIVVDDDDDGGNDPIWVKTNGTRTDSESAFDYNDNDITASMVTTNAADLTTEGDYTETYNVTDPTTGLTATATRTVKVRNYIGSVMTLNGDATMLVPLGGTFNDPGVTLIDRLFGDVSGDEDPEAGDIVDVNTAGTYNMVYEYIGSYDNNVPVSVSRTVKVSTPPTITLVGNATETVALNGTYTDAGATANDAEDGDITASIVTVNPVDTSVAGTYTVTYNVTDSAGFAATEVTRTVTVS